MFTNLIWKNDSCWANIPRCLMHHVSGILFTCGQVALMEILCSFSLHLKFNKKRLLLTIIHRLHLYLTNIYCWASAQTLQCNKCRKSLLMSTLPLAWILQKCPFVLYLYTEINWTPELMVLCTSNIFRSFSI